MASAGEKVILVTGATGQQVRKASDEFATMLEWFDRVGYSAEIAANAKELGIAPTKLEDWAAR